MGQSCEKGPLVNISLYSAFLSYSLSRISTGDTCIRSRMLSYCILLLLPMALANPVNTDEFAVGTEEDHETLKQLVMDLFRVREDREIDVEVDEDGVASNSAVDTDKLAVDGEPKVVEDPAEIDRFNNYMDAVYRRMNAAVRAKMMDPMVLNLSNGKSDKK